MLAFVVLLNHPGSERRKPHPLVFHCASAIRRVPCLKFGAVASLEHPRPNPVDGADPNIFGAPANILGCAYPIRSVIDPYAVDKPKASAHGAGLVTDGGNLIVGGL